MRDEKWVMQSNRRLEGVVKGESEFLAKGGGSMKL